MWLFFEDGGDDGDTFDAVLCNYLVATLVPSVLAYEN